MRTTRSRTRTFASRWGGNGITANEGSTVQRNTVRSNGTGPFGGYGLNLGSTAAYRENVITSNATGTVLGGGQNLGANFCSGPGVGSASCP